MQDVEERQQSRRTLVCLLQALEGRNTTIELRNETSIDGRVVHVDGMMNVALASATFNTPDGTKLELQDAFIQGRQIRYVHIPEDIDIMQAIRKQISELTTRKPSEARRRTRGRGRSRAIRRH
ncbi:U7 snRNA-associated Sm-like protein LSm10 [Corticium candelabrum]|uniref:U7 snRNA-associated Sm-like protein LSm10 n=1 Tax=Corticium candelabrum TaxID=121492 RepID=UPI002E271E72|nr:U7 snRNA-associated Sm-like protein LSm10 [Corticium candelabrum]